MNKYLKGSLLIISFFSMFSVASAEIAGSAHDFSSTAWSAGMVCDACHTPHNADASVADYGPLWNHENSTQVYSVYASSTMDVPVGQPGGVSKLCLSCHDGTIAVDSFGGTTGSTLLTGSAAVGSGGHLEDDHPIGIEWRHQTVSGSNCFTCHFGSPRQVEFFGRSGSFLGTMECASCHDPHNGKNYPKMLRAPLAGSELCFQCHTDKS
ncbi:MAG: cytochrome c3 family protein [Desulfuromusa sp.]|nr:cytochrome c3 family protein [Desulfuromusa sp.]